jgi:hypothetical protein
MRRAYNHHEGRMVAKILTDPEYDDDEDPYRMAEAIVRAINERRSQEKLRVAALYSEGKLHSLWGPYTTMKAAEADIRKGGVIGTKRECWAKLFVLVTSDTEQEEADDEVPG